MPTNFLRSNLLITDIGFLAYWLAAAIGMFPPEWLYSNHEDPIMVAWNWSFAPIDLTASALGLYSLALSRLGKPAWRTYCVISASLTFCAGLMAVSFWAIQRDFNFGWWLPNLYLVLRPVIAVRQLAREHGEA